MMLFAGLRQQCSHSLVLLVATCCWIAGRTFAADVAANISSPFFEIQNDTIALNSTGTDNLTFSAWPRLPHTIAFDNDHGKLIFTRLGPQGSSNDLTALSQLFRLLELRLIPQVWTYSRHDIYCLVPSLAPSLGLALSFSIRFPSYEESALKVYLPYLFDTLEEQLIENGFRALSAELAIVPSTAALVKIDKRVEPTGLRAFRPVFVTVPGSMDLLIEISDAGERFDLPGDAVGTLESLLLRAKASINTDTSPHFSSVMASKGTGAASLLAGTVFFSFRIDRAAAPAALGRFTHENAEDMVDAVGALVKGAEPSQIRFKLLSCFDYDRCYSIGRGLMWKGGSSADQMAFLNNGTVADDTDGGVGATANETGAASSVSRDAIPLDPEGTYSEVQEVT